MGFQIGILFLLISHLLLLSFTNYSLTGYWTDFAFPLVVLFLWIYIYVRNVKRRKIKFVNIKYSILLVTSVYILLGLVHINSKGFFNFLTSAKTTSFHWKLENKRLFNVYFQPVGGYSGGEGNLWITESPIAFPVFEKQVYYEHAVVWDYSLKEWDGQKVNREKIVRQKIQESLIAKKK